MTNTTDISNLAAAGLAAKGILSPHATAVEVRHESEGIAARFYIKDMEKNGRMVVKVAIDKESSRKFTKESIAATIVDTAIEMLGMTLAQN